MQHNQNSLATSHNTPLIINAEKTKAQGTILAAAPFTKSKLRKSKKNKIKYLANTPHSRLGPYPEPLYFINHRTKKIILAYKWGENRVRIFIMKKKYNITSSGKLNYINTSIGSRIISKEEFNTRYSFVPIVDLKDPALCTLSKKKECSICHKTKFLIEFHHNTKKRNSRSDRCILCIAASKEAAMNFDREGDFMSLDRSIRDNFVRYMKANPVYFEWAYQCEFSKENIMSAYDDVINNSRMLSDNSIQRLYREETGYGL